MTNFIVTQTIHHKPKTVATFFQRQNHFPAPEYQLSQFGVSSGNHHVTKSLHFSGKAMLVEVC